MSRFRTDRTPARRTVQSAACSPSAPQREKSSLRQRWRHWMRHARLLAGVLAVLMVAAAGPVSAGATPVQKCAAGKKKAAGKRISCETSCDAAAIATGGTPESTCLQNCKTRFEEKWANLQMKGGCVEPCDPPLGVCCDQPKVTTSVEGLGDALYGALNSPAGACGSAKMEQAGKAAYCLLKCYAKAQAKGIPFDPNCVDVGPKSCIRKFTDKCMADGNCGTLTCGQLADVIIEPSVKDVKVELPTHFTCGHVDACVDTGEDCDPSGSTTGLWGTCAAGETCNGTCTDCEVRCGDGVKNFDGNNGDIEGCDPPYSTNGAPAGESCSGCPEGQPCSLTGPVACRGYRVQCGDGVVGDGEVCDRDPATHQSTCTPGTGTSCTSDCTACVAVCGDGVPAPAASHPETCERDPYTHVSTCTPGVTPNCDTQTSTCVSGTSCNTDPASATRCQECVEVCHDGVKGPDEVCDTDLNSAQGLGCPPGLACTHGCTTAEGATCAAVCGDGLLGGTEQCDRPFGARGACDDF